MPNIPSSTCLLCEEDLLRTYPDSQDPVKTAEQYRRAHNLRRNDSSRTRASIARDVGRKPSVLRGWLVEGSKPRVIQALETADELGLVPLRADDRVFDSLNTLLAWVYAGGSINPDTFQPSLTINHRLHRAVAGPLLNPIGVGWRSIRASDTKQTHELRPRDGGAVLGRLLHALGAPKGGKSEQSVTLPSYLADVSDYHRRAFARMYLLHRGGHANADGQSLTIQESRDLDYFRSLQALFKSVTGVEVTINESTPELYLPTDAIAALAGRTNSPKVGLAARLIYGEDGDLVSERRFLNTYSANSNPWTVYHQYRAVLEANTQDDTLNKSQLAREVGVNRSTVRQWLDGRMPYAVQGLETARDRGWIGVRAAGKNFALLNRLAAWLFVAGYIGESNLHPRFTIRGKVHATTLDDILSMLDIKYQTQSSGNTPEVHPQADGAILGRVLHVLGVPLGKQTEDPLISLPVYLESAPESVRQDFALVYLLNRRRWGASNGEGLTIYHPDYTEAYLDDLQQFFQSLVDETVIREEENIKLSEEAVQSLVPDFDSDVPDESIVASLGSRL